MATPNDFASIVSEIYQGMVANGYTGTEADLAVALSALSDDNGATTKWIDLGASSAYAIAVEHGYTGNEDEWIALLMNTTQNAQIAQESADSAAESAASAKQSEEAIPAKKDEALQAIASAETNALQSVNTAGTTQTGNVNTAGQTQVQAVNSAGTTQVGLVEQEGSDQKDVVVAEGEKQTQRVSNQGILEVQAVAGEGTRQTGLVTSEGTTQVARVTAEGTTQVGNVSDEGASQIAAVQAKGAEVIDSIPADYSALTKDVSVLESDVSNLAIVTPTDEKNVSIADSLSAYDENYVNFGSIGSNGAFSASNDYRTYYYQATEALSAYVTRTEEPSYYLSIAIFGETISKSTFVARYRSTDNNLPTPENRLAIPSSAWIAISISHNNTYPNRDFKLYTGIYDSYEVDVTSKLMDSVEKNLVYRNGHVDKTADKITVYLGKYKFEVKYVNREDIRANVWRTNACYVKNNSGEYVTIWKDSDSDGVVKLTGESDFIGGYHGDEIQSSFKLLIDGVEFASDSIISGMPFGELMIFVESDVYHCNTSESASVVAFKRNKIITFNNDGYTVQNYWVAQEALSVNVAYMGMLSVQRYIGDTSDYLITGYHNNLTNKYTSADDATDGSHYITQVLFNTVYGDIGIKMFDMLPSEYTKGLVSSYTGNSERLKAYMSIMSSTAIQQGDVIRAKATTYFR